MEKRLRYTKDIAFLACLVCAVFLLLGMSTPDWSVIGEESHGLWLNCSQIHEYRHCSKLHSSQISPVLHLIRAFITPALVCEAAAVVLSCLWSKQEPKAKEHYITLEGKLSLSLAGSGGLLSIISTLLFCFEIAEDINALNWSYYLTLVSGVAICISSIFTAIIVVYLNHVKVETPEQLKSESNKSESQV